MSGGGNRAAFGREERRAANDAQVMTFFRGYERTWRLAKILLNRSLLVRRAEVHPELREALGPRCDDDYVYGPVTNGLLFSAIAELTMLAEDLFALVKFVRSRERFANLLMHYSAGKVTSLAGQLKSASRERILSAFMVPSIGMLADVTESVAEEHRCGTALLARLVENAVRVHEKYDRLYTQYKHGLTVALRPFGGGPLAPEALARRRTHTSGTVIAYKAVGFGKTRKGPPEAVVAMTLLPETQPFLAELDRDDNFLRYDGRFRDTSIDEIVADAYALTKLVEVMVLNRADLIAPQGANPAANTFWLPIDDATAPLAHMRIEVTRRDGRWTLDSFREEL